MAEKIRVGYDASVTLMPRLRGVGRYTLSLLEAMVRLGGGEFEFVVLLNSLRHRPGPRHQFLFDSPSVKVVERRIPGGLLVESWRVAGLPSWESLVGRCDIVHAPSSYIPPTEAPLVVSVMDLSFLRDPGTPARLGGGWFRKVFPRKLPQAQAIVAISDHVARDVAQTYRVDPARIHTIHPGIDLETFCPEPHPDDEMTLARLGLEPGYILAPTEDHPRKRPELVAGIAERLSREGAGIPVVAVGLPKSWERENLRCLDWVSDTELASLYRGALAVVLTTREEGFGFPLMEAAACGKFVVCGKHSSLVELGGDFARWVTDETVEGYSRVIIECRHSLAGFHKAPENPVSQTNATWESSVLKTLALYKSLSKKYPPPPINVNK